MSEDVFYIWYNGFRATKKRRELPALLSEYYAGKCAVKSFFTVQPSSFFPDYTIVSALFNLFAGIPPPIRQNRVPKGEKPQVRCTCDSSFQVRERYSSSTPSSRSAAR